MTPFLSLGRTPLANALLRREQLGEPQELFPLDVVFCPECALVQITETVPPETLFRNYLYFSSFSDTTLQNAREIAERLTRTRRLGPSSHVIEIASNDGYLLQNYRRAGVPVLGIEPAQNIARVAEERGIPTLADFFRPSLAGDLAKKGLLADVIHANNVLAHVADTRGVINGFRTLLKPDGVAVVEAPYVVDMIDHVEFDTIYHEHLCYFSLTALVQLFSREGLSITDVERLPIHGGSLRVFAMRSDSAVAPSDRVRALLAEEDRRHANKLSFYSDFGRRVEHLRDTLCALLRRLKAEGAHIAAYGASAKGSTLLNYFGLGAETIDYIVDRSTVKQGLYSPGKHLLISPPERLLETQPEYVLLLTWNFAAEILAQQAEYRRRGGRFIVPIPEPTVV